MVGIVARPRADPLTPHSERASADPRSPKMDAHAFAQHARSVEGRREVLRLFHMRGLIHEDVGHAASYFVYNPTRRVHSVLMSYIEKIKSMPHSRPVCDFNILAPRHCSNSGLLCL